MGFSERKEHLLGSFDIKGMIIGEGIPKTIISVMDAEVEGALATIEKGKSLGVNCFEWRADYCTAVHDHAKMVEDVRRIAEVVPEHPLLFTFRSKFEGGNIEIPISEYVELNKAIIGTGCVDMVDIEIIIGEEAVKDLVAFAHEHDTAVVISYHNFRGTPSVDWMVNMLTRMDKLGADVPKIAVMAQNAEDACKLMAATAEVRRVHTKKPLLTMAMSKEGSISRVTGELTGSAITFCSLESSSAPGQIPVQKAHEMMSLLHEVLA